VWLPHHENMGVGCEAAHIRASRFGLNQSAIAGMEVPMKRLIIATLAGFALAAAATTMLWSRTADHTVDSASTVLSKEQHKAAAVNKLPVEEFEDMSLVYSRAAPKP
jgi:hypothetical protein